MATRRNHARVEPDWVDTCCVEVGLEPLRPLVAVSVTICNEQASRSVRNSTCSSSREDSGYRVGVVPRPASRSGAGAGCVALAVRS